MANEKTPLTAPPFLSDFERQQNAAVAAAAAKKKTARKKRVLWLLAALVLAAAIVFLTRPNTAAASPEAQPITTKTGELFCGITNHDAGYVKLPNKKDDHYF
ncbi:Serine protease family s10, partial [Globisporangium polare]